MHELFINAIVPDEKALGILMIIQGLCAMTPVREVEWRLLFEGPRTPPLGMTNQMSSRNKANLQYWKELHTQLARQSYYLTVAYDLGDEDFGRANSNAEEQPGEQSFGINLQERDGTLRFLEFPEPLGSRTVHSRLAINIGDETQLPAFLNANRYRYIKDTIREAHYAYRHNTIYCLSRDYLRPQSHAEATTQALPSHLPPFENLIPFDPERKWVLSVSVEVSNGDKPDLMKKGIEELEKVKHDLEGILEFPLTARQKLDTRIPLQR